MLEHNFSHVANFTGYMQTVFRIADNGGAGRKILDIPAGNGLLAERLQQRGHTVICGDINQARPHYVYVDLNQQLPFHDNEFDLCLCLEGIEHVLSPAALVRDLCRITKPGGRIVISLPNIQNVFSRFQFLCTGYFYQFAPWTTRQLKPGELIDRGHISSLSYLQLRYLFQNYGAVLSELTGDRWKKKWLIPFIGPFIAAGWVWSRLGLKRHKEAPRSDCLEMLKDLFSPALLFSRSLILVFERQ